MIREVGDAVGSTVFEFLGRALGRTQEQRPLPVDLYESEAAFLAVFDAPGVAGHDVQVGYEDGAIVVRVDRFRDFYEGFEMQFPGRGLTLDGRVELPDDAAVDPTEASATLNDDGTLHVLVPKVESPAGEGDTDGADDLTDEEGPADDEDEA
ncbi:molecular chaperone Hsp20 [Halobacteriales archaeon QH_2_65_14]|nr:MAG: molecular chaperone Hsp20 [Halobacteriales archaeon QH_2_65_14]